MKRIFARYVLFLLCLEMLFHFACFHTVGVGTALFSLFVSVLVGGFLTIVSSFVPKEKIQTIFGKVFAILVIVLFSAELVYFRIYESFFSFNGIQFAGALIGGYDKILKTIFQNFFYILLFFTPVGFFFWKVPKLERNRMDMILVLLFMVVCGSYLGVSVQFLNKSGENSLYQLVHFKNMPVLNVQKMGLIGSTSLSLHRRLFGFNPDLLVEEDNLSNKRSYLMDRVDTEYNMDSSIDFRKLIREESNETIRYLHSYFEKQDPTEQNSYTGIFQEKNVIFIMAESFDEIAIDPELTPTLYKLKKDGIHFHNYFSPKYPASTADGEYMLEWGTLPIIGENYSLIDMVYNTNPYLLPRVLKKYHYKTYAYHNYFGYYNNRSSYFATLDFDRTRYCQDGIDMKCEFFHGSDMDMMDQTIDDYIGQDRFYAYYITLSGHGSYDSSNFVAEKHLDKVQNLPYSSQIKYYLAANIDFDLAMEKLMRKLEEAGRLDDTLIVISSDHSPYYLSNSEVNSVSSFDRDNKFDRNRGSLLIYNHAYKNHEDIYKYAMNIDVLPTVLNMLNIPYDSRIIIGKDIMAPNNPGVVIFPDRSWINNKGSYDTATSTFRSFEDGIDEKYAKQISNEVNEKYDVSVSMQYNDYYKYIFR